MDLTKTLAERISERLRWHGYDCSPLDVWEVRDLGHLERDGADALASAILQEIKELGIEMAP